LGNATPALVAFPDNRTAENVQQRDVGAGSAGAGICGIALDTFFVPVFVDLFIVSFTISRLRQALPQGETSRGQNCSNVLDGLAPLQERERRDELPDHIAPQEKLVYLLLGAERARPPNLPGRWARL
jgi:hypothetical protein